MLFQKVLGLLEDGALLEEVGRWRWGLKFYGLATLPVCSLFPVLPRYEEAKNSVHIPLLAWGCLLPHGLLHNGFTLSNRQQISPSSHAFFFVRYLARAAQRKKRTNSYHIEDVWDYFHWLKNPDILGCDFRVMKIKIYTMSVLVATD